MARQCHTSSLGTETELRTEEPAPPDGFTFSPDDEQLVVHYLRAYAAGRSLWCDHVVEADVYSTDPWTLLGDGHEIAYFLTKRTRHGNRVKRTAGGGTWIGQTRKKEIVSTRGEVVGFKTMLSFCIGDDHPDDCSKKPPRKTSGYVMYEYELPSTADNGTRQQGASQEPVLCCVKKSAREIARSHKRKRAEAAQAPAAETNTAAYIHNADKRARRPAQISEPGLEHGSSNSISSCILAPPKSAAAEFADSSAFPDEALLAALAGIPPPLFAADPVCALLLCLSAAAFSDGPLEMTMAVDQQQQQQILYHGDDVVTTNANFFQADGCGYYSTIPEYADSVTLADFGTPWSMCAPDYSTGLLSMMASSTGEINCAHHSLPGMTAGVKQWPIPDHDEWTAMMNTGIFDGLGRDANVGDIVGSTAVEGAGNHQPPPLPYELIGEKTTAAATADRQLLLPPDQDKQRVSEEAAGSLDQLLSVLDNAGFSDWYDSLFNAEPSPPPLVDLEIPLRDCRTPPAPSSDGTASSAATEVATKR